MSCHIYVYHNVIMVVDSPQKNNNHHLKEKKNLRLLCAWIIIMNYKTARTALLLNNTNNLIRTNGTLTNEMSEMDITLNLNGIDYIFKSHYHHHICQKNPRPDAILKHTITYIGKITAIFPRRFIYRLTERWRDCGTLARIFDRWHGVFMCTFVTWVHAQSKEEKAKIVIGKSWR